MLKLDKINLTTKSAQLVHKLMKQHSATYGEMLSVDDAINILISGDKNET